MTQAWDFVNAAILWERYPADMPVDQVDWGENAARIRNVFFNNRIQTLGQLAELHQFELLRMPNVGRKSVERIRAALEAHGMKFKGHYD